MSEPRKLASDIERLRRELRESETALSGIQSRCRHEFGPVSYDPIVREAYTHPGDPPGTMGVDWRGPMYIPREETRQWKRTCPKCNLTQYTQRTKSRQIRGSFPGTNATEEAPEF